MTRKIRLVGQTELKNHDGDGMVNHVALEVDAGKTTFSARHPNVTALPPLDAISDSPEVANFMRKVNFSMEQTAQWLRGRERPALAFPKPKEIAGAVVSTLPDRHPVACPACHGEGYFMCDLCDGEGAVPRYRADEWRQRTRDTLTG